MHSQPIPRRLQYVEQTRLAILDSAEELFMRDGYHATSVDSIAAAAGFTKGAVYRQFQDKEALFVAVFARVETDTISKLTPAASASDAGTGALQALAVFLHASTELRFRRIVLEEGPAALGWRRWRNLDTHHTAAYLEALLAELVNAGVIRRRPLPPLARMCCALIGEAAILVSEADDPAAAEAAALETLGAMLAGLESRPSKLS